MELFLSFFIPLGERLKENEGNMLPSIHSRSSYTEWIKMAMDSSTLLPSRQGSLSPRLNSERRAL